MNKLVTVIAIALIATAVSCDSEDMIVGGFSRAQGISPDAKVEVINMLTNATT